MNSKKERRAIRNFFSAAETAGLSARVDISGMRGSPKYSIMVYDLGSKDVLYWDRSDSLESVRNGIRFSRRVAYGKSVKYRRIKGVTDGYRYFYTEKLGEMIRKNFLNRDDLDTADISLLYRYLAKKRKRDIVEKWDGYKKEGFEKFLSFIEHTGPTYSIDFRDGNFYIYGSIITSEVTEVPLSSVAGNSFDEAIELFNDEQVRNFEKGLTSSGRELLFTTAKRLKKGIMKYYIPKLIPPEKTDDEIVKAVIDTIKLKGIK